ncbi:olfactory receptor 5V1-like [Sphaerodactylus townsendi]|uniref:olfactory receptor 5V1-like n=1 Tax=Sphaerodactylus townsendi TaxID=933632 RepID=UPI002025F2AF|nr:olfactory receptor 5V1-like [Sphaerodactylus townsendi]
MGKPPPSVSPIHGGDPAGMTTSWCRNTGNPRASTLLTLKQGKGRDTEVRLDREHPAQGTTVSVKQAELTTTESYYKDELNQNISSGEGEKRKMSFELSLGIGNQTQVVEFVLLGFSGILYGHTYLALAFLAIYLVTVLGNLMIFTMIQLKSSLHTPMYYFLSHLSCLDMCLSSVTVPKMLVNLLLQQQTISYNQCMAQMFFLISFTAVEAALLGVMAYDRYTAICKPLHYSHLMNTKVCTVLAFATWVCGFLNSALHTALSTRLDFCGINQIHHIFCDLPPLMKMACSDTHINGLAVNIVGFFMGGGPLLFIIFSYISILSSILKIQSTIGKRKAFSTCASHLMVVFIYYGNALLNYERPSAGYSLATGTLLSIMFCIITPMLNPLIYSLRNKEVKEALKKATEIWRPSKHHRSLLGHVSPEWCELWD